MSTTATVDGTSGDAGSDAAGSGWQEVARAAWREVRPHTPAQRLVAGVGLLLAGVGLAHLGVQAVDGGPWEGPVSWRKPVVFGLSLGLLLLTVGAVLRWLPGRRAQWWVGGPLAVASVAEYVAITSQRWRGVPSHFNDETPYDSAVFGVMAVSVAVIVLAVALLAVLVALPLRGGFSGDAALRLGLLVGLGAVLLSGWVGGRMIAEGTQVVAATGAVPDSVVFGAQGSAKLFHAVGQHGVQVLLVVALLLRVTGTPVRRALALTATASVGYVLVLAGVGAAALRGEGWLTLPPALLLPAVPGTVLLGVVGAAVLARVRRPAVLAARGRPVVG